MMGELGVTSRMRLQRINTVLTGFVILKHRPSCGILVLRLGELR